MSGALDPANTFIGRHTLQGILGTAGSSVELGTEQMAILPNGDHGMSWMHADSTLASVTGQTGLLEQHFGANALAASVPAQVAADTAHPQHAIYRELMLEQRPALFEHVGSGNFAVHAAPGGGGGAAGAAEGGSALRASGGKGKLIGVGIGVIVAAAAAAAVLNGQRSASAVGVATKGTPADSPEGSAKAGASSSTAHAGDVSTTTHKVAGDDAKSQHGADNGAVTGGGAPSAEQQSINSLRPGTVLQAGVDRTELSAKELAARTTELTAVAARDPKSEAGKRAQIALRALGEAGRDIVATNADKSVSGAVGAYMAASGAAAADRPWSGDFAAWASQPVHKLGFDGGGFRDLNDQINWMGNEDIIPMLRTDHVQEATSADESHGRDPALPKVGDMLVLSMYGDDLGLDRFGIVTSIEDGSMTAVIGDGTRADGQRGVVTRTFTQDDGRLLGSIDTINVKDVARPVPPPPPPPPSPAVTSRAVKSRPHLRGDLGNPEGNPVFEETLDRLERIGEIMGQPLVVRSGSRTLAEQKSLWDLHAANPSKPIAAFPRADAPHIRGIAADVGVGPVGEGVSLYNVKGSSAAVASVNMAFTMLHRGEPWHIQQSGPWQR